MQLRRYIHALRHKCRIAFYRVAVLGFYLKRYLRHGSQHKTCTAVHTHKGVLLGDTQPVLVGLVVIARIVGAVYLAPHLGQIHFRTAAAILLLYLALTVVGAAIIGAVEGLPLGACLYETASAAGTVGLTLGLTPQLGTLSQGILILLMFFGRVGGLTLIYAAFSGHDLTYARYPQEKITVG